MNALYSKYFPYYTVLNESVLLLSHGENTCSCIRGYFRPSSLQTISHRLEINQTKL